MSLLEDPVAELLDPRWWEELVGYFKEHWSSVANTGQHFQRLLTGAAWVNLLMAFRFPVPCLFLV